MNTGNEVRRMDVRFEGHVQGVGFRWTTARLAAGFPISGFVRNEPDGSVRLTAEGREADLLAFLQAIEISPVGRYISRRQVEWRDATGEFRAFEIGY